MERGGTLKRRARAQQITVSLSNMVQKGGNELKERFLVVIDVPLMACKPWSGSGVGHINAVCVLPWERGSLWYGGSVGEEEVVVLLPLWPSTEPAAAITEIE